MIKAAFLGLDKYIKHKPVLESDEISIDFSNWDDLSDEAIIQYKLIVIHLDQSQIDLVYFIREKFQQQPVAIVVFLTEYAADAVADFLVSGADIVDVLPAEPAGIKPILEYALDMLDVGGVQLDSISHSITEAVNEVFMTMVQMSVELKEIRHEKLKMPDDNLAIMMHVKGQLSGPIMLILSYDLGARIISKILSVEPELLERPDIKEGIFEIVNMIAGGTKARISDFDHTYTLTPPTALEEYNKHAYIDKNGTFLHFRNEQQDEFSIFYHFE